MTLRSLSGRDSGDLRRRCKKLLREWRASRPLRRPIDEEGDAWNAGWNAGLKEGLAFEKKPFH